MPKNISDPERNGLLGLTSALSGLAFGGAVLGLALVGHELLPDQAEKEIAVRTELARASCIRENLERQWPDLIAVFKNGGIAATATVSATDIEQCSTQQGLKEYAEVRTSYEDAAKILQFGGLLMGITSITAACFMRRPSLASEQPVKTRTDEFSPSP